MVHYVTPLCHLQQSTEVHLSSYGAETHPHSEKQHWLITVKPIVISIIATNR